MEEFEKRSGGGSIERKRDDQPPGKARGSVISIDMPKKN